MAPSSSIRDLAAQVPGMEVLPWIGEVTEMVGLLIASRGPVVSIGDFVEVRTSSGRSIRSQVIGFRNDRVLSMPLEETDGLQPGDRVIARRDDALAAGGPGTAGPGAGWIRAAAGRRSADARLQPPILCTPRLLNLWTANTSSSRWLPGFAPSMACCPAAKDSAWEFSEAAASARARCSA